MTVDGRSGSRKPRPHLHLVLPIVAALLFLARPTMAQERSPTERALDAINRRSMELLGKEMKVPPAAISLFMTASGCRWRFGYAAPNGAAMFDPPPCATKLCALGLDPDHSPRIPVGRTVRLVVASTSPGRHRFAVPTLGLKVEAETGETHEAWVEAKIAGNFVGSPSPGCESDASAAAASILAVDQRDFDGWLARLPSSPGSSKLTAEPKP